MTEWARITKTIEAKIRETNQPRPGTPGLKIAPPQRKASLASVVPDTPTPASSGAAPVRPIIKLKMGGPKTNGSPLPTPSAETAQPTPKLKVRKPKEPKLSEVPPPEPRRDSYFETTGDVDDELLEEVIAIEREKNQERKLQRSSAEKDKDKVREQREKEQERERSREREREREKG